MHLNATMAMIAVSCSDVTLAATAPVRNIASRAAQRMRQVVDVAKTLAAWDATERHGYADILALGLRYDVASDRAQNLLVKKGAVGDLLPRPLEARR